MEKNPDQVYGELLRQLARPAGAEPEVLANTFRDVERMHAQGQITDWQLHNAREAYARTPDSRLAQATSWAIEKAKEGLEAGAGFVGDRTRIAVTAYTRQDPIRALLIAAGTGALLMGLAALLARSGVRKVTKATRR